ncbi:tetratricopeptide repeat protein [Archangium lansingense]|uniref:tetratricopeptide repeat protein n=1 Tax=Archangium lansingense TaxID=2995310 RepID=UPI003B7BCDDF
MDLVNTARKLYDELDYDRALEVLSRARQLKRGQDADVTLWLYQGIILFDAGKHEESAKAFREALKQRPQVKLPLPIVSPKMGQFFDSLRQEFNRPQVASELNAPRAGATPLAAPSAPPQAGLVSRMEEKAASGRRPFAPQVIVSAAAGGSLLATGGIFFGLSQGERARIRADDPRLGSREELRRSAARGATYQALGLGFMGAGLVGLGVATGLHLLRVPQAPLSLTVSTDGTSAFVQGRLP